MDVEPTEVFNQGADMINNAFILFVGITILLILGGVWLLNKKGKLAIPLVTKFNYSVTVLEPATDGVVQRYTKARKFEDVEEGTTYLEISEGMFKKTKRCLMPGFEFFSSNGHIFLWSPAADEFYPCKFDMQQKVNGKNVERTAMLKPQIDKSMKYVFANTLKTIAVRNRERTWMDSVMPLASVLLLGIIALMFIYVTWSQSGAYMENVANKFMEASNNFACPTTPPPL